MLLSLHVKNLAIIDEAEINFGPGLNILSGETGAGKSVLIGSINLTLGGKAKKDIIRTGCDSAFTELVFTVNDVITKKLHEIEIEPEDGLVIIERKFTPERNISRINGETATLTKVRAAASILLDVHGQQETATLLTPKTHLVLLDSYCHAEANPVKSEVAKLVKELRSKESELASLLGDSEAAKREADFLQFELDEIENAELKEGEEEELDEKYRRYASSEKINAALSETEELIDGDDGAGDKIGAAVRAIGKLSELKDAAGLIDEIGQIEDLLSDFSRSLSDFADDYAFDEEDFNEITNRLDLIRGIYAKHGGSYETTMVFADEASEKIDKFSHLEEYKEKLSKEIAELKKKAANECGKLTKIRKKYAAVFTEKVANALTELNFLQVKFDVKVEDAPMTEKGADDVAFLISTNPGEPLRPLSEIASGGELSRIMLAIKSVMADTDDIPTLIFDEIDTGISGRTAQAVAVKMAEIAKSRQVLAITHLAQIAAMADKHFLIEKKTDTKTTATSIRELTGDEITGELARILGGAEITDSVRQTAEEMKKQADTLKGKLK